MIANLIKEKAGIMYGLLFDALLTWFVPGLFPESEN
jgi:hypothetical protein